MRSRVTFFVCAIAAVILALGLAAHTQGQTMAPPAAESDAVALMAMADLERDHAGEARKRLHLLATRGPGWGLAFRWDAFADGTVNPRSTVYSYTTAMVGLAFADAYARTRDHRYLAEARAAANELAGPGLCCWRDGRAAGVWYSDQPSDHQAAYRVYNVSGLTLALLSRLRGHRELAAELRRGLLDARTVDGWPYMSGATTPNDLIHAAFIVVGLYAAGAKRAARAEMSRLWNAALPAGQPQSGASTWGSSGWGPSAGLWALVETGECRRAAELELNLTRPQNDRAAAWYMMARATFRRVCG